jgi:hypothetical protein
MHDPGASSQTHPVLVGVVQVRRVRSDLSTAVVLMSTPDGLLLEAALI